MRRKNRFSQLYSGPGSGMQIPAVRCTMWGVRACLYSDLADVAVSDEDSISLVHATVSNTAG